MTFTRKQRSLYLVCLIFFALSFLIYHYHSNFLPQPPGFQRSDHSERPFGPGVAKHLREVYTRTLVMGRLKSDDVSWMQGIERLNRSYGILTYIIDNYDSLPDTVLFFHPHRTTWHNNVLLDLDSKKTIERLSDARVAREGYFNARCHLDPGCPDWLRPDRPPAEWDLVHKKEERFFAPKVWRELHPDAPVPRSISQPCCAQFAVSGERIRSHPRSEYLRYRDWLLNTELEDEYSGRIMEYTWQYIFTGQSEFCPSQHECYCDGYGICFGGRTDAALQHWLDLLKQREKANERLSALLGNSPDDVHSIRATADERDALKQELERLKQEAYKRGDDPKNRALECGRPGKEGDGL